MIGCSKIGDRELADPEIASRSVNSWIYAFGDGDHFYRKLGDGETGFFHFSDELHGLDLFALTKTIQDRLPGSGREAFY